MSRRRSLRRHVGRRAIGAILAALAVLLATRTDLLNRHPANDRGGDDFPRYDGKTVLVTKAVDGDTLHIESLDRTYGTTVRLWGVDTPETVKPHTPVQYFGPEASAFTKRLTQGQQVRLELVAGRKSRDKYNRLLAYVFLPDGQMLNRRLVVEGYAYAEPQFEHPYKKEFWSDMMDARKHKRGLWAGVKKEDIPEYLAGRVEP